MVRWMKTKGEVERSDLEVGVGRMGVGKGGWRLEMEMENVCLKVEETVWKQKRSNVVL